jgi:hypothetical protein
VWCFSLLFGWICPLFVTTFTDVLCDWSTTDRRTYSSTRTVKTSDIEQEKVHASLPAHSQKAVTLYAMKALGGGRNYSFYSFTTSALDGVSGQHHGPALALAPGKGQEAGWAPEPVRAQKREEKSFRLFRESNFNRPVVQSITRHYTYWLSYNDFHQHTALNHNIRPANKLFDGVQSSTIL